MAYATVDDVLKAMDRDVLIRLTDDEGIGDVDTARVQRALDDASEEVDGYVGSRYAVPLDPAPPILRKLTVDIAVYNLYSRLDEPPEHRAERYRTALEFLSRVALGKISLGPQDPDGNPPASDAPELSADNPPRLFSRATMEDF